MFRLLTCLLLCLIVAPAPLPHRQMARLAPATEDPILLSVTDDGSPLPDKDNMGLLAGRNRIAFLENCLRRHGRDVKGYRALLAKHERLEGKLVEPELVRVAFREQPH